MADQDHQGQDARSRIIDMKLPLSWLVGSAVAIVMAFAYVSFAVDRMREDMTEVKATLKAWNDRISSTTAEVALLRFRVETLEADKRALGGSK